MSLPTFTPETRRRLYDVLSAVLPLLATYGVVDQPTAQAWIALAAALLASPTLRLAARHVPDAADYAGRHRLDE